MRRGNLVYEEPRFLGSNATAWLIARHPGHTSILTRDAFFRSLENSLSRRGGFRRRWNAYTRIHAFCLENKRVQRASLPGIKRFGPPPSLRSQCLRGWWVGAIRIFLGIFLLELKCVSYENSNYSFVRYIRIFIPFNELLLGESVSFYSEFSRSRKMFSYLEFGINARTELSVRYWKFHEFTIFKMLKVKICM